MASKKETRNMATAAGPSDSEILDDLNQMEKAETEAGKKAKAAKDLAELQSLEVVNASSEKVKVITLPAGMTEQKAIRVLHEKLKEKESDVAIHELIDAWPMDGAVAFQAVLKEVYNWPKMIPTPGFFGPNPPVQLGVRINAAGDTVQTSWGRVALPNVDGYLETGFAEHNGEWKFKIGGVVKRKHEKDISNLAKLVREYVAKNSIYKNKAVKIDFRDNDGERKSFNPADSPEFIAIDESKLDDVVYPREIEDVVNMTLFYPVIYKDAARVMGTPLKRGTLLEGPYGTGKTLTAYQLAAHGLKHGWTFIYLMDVRDLDLAMKFASHYSPAIVFAEDIDQVAKMGMRDKAEVNRLTNVLDGIDSKGKEISVVFTTNFKNAIDPVFIRPGRIDSVVTLTPPDREAAVRLTRKYGRTKLGASILDANLTDDEIGDALEPLVQLSANAAFIREAVERAKLASLPEFAKTQVLALTKDDLFVAAKSMIPHLELHRAQMGDGTESDASMGLGSILSAFMNPSFIKKMQRDMRKRQPSGPVG